jgi:hypothetical protein
MLRSSFLLAGFGMLLLGFAGAADIDDQLSRTLERLSANRRTSLSADSMAHLVDDAAAVGLTLDPGLPLHGLTDAQVQAMTSTIRGLVAASDFADASDVKRAACLRAIETFVAGMPSATPGVHLGDVEFRQRLDLETRRLTHCLNAPDIWKAGLVTPADEPAVRRQLEQLSRHVADVAARRFELAEEVPEIRKTIAEELSRSMEISIRQPLAPGFKVPLSEEELERFMDDIEREFPQRVDLSPLLNVPAVPDGTIPADGNVSLAHDQAESLKSAREFMITGQVKGRVAVLLSWIGGRYAEHALRTRFHGLRFGTPQTHEETRTLQQTFEGLQTLERERGGQWQALMDRVAGIQQRAFFERVTQSDPLRPIPEPVPRDQRLIRWIWLALNAAGLLILGAMLWRRRGRRRGPAPAQILPEANR